MKLDLCGLSLAQNVAALGLLNPCDPAEVWTEFPSLFEGQPGVQVTRPPYQFRWERPESGPSAEDLKTAADSPPPYRWAAAEERVIRLVRERPLVIVNAEDAWGTQTPDRLWWSELLEVASGLNLIQLHGGQLPIPVITCPQLRAQLRWIAGSRAVVAKKGSWAQAFAAVVGVPVLEAETRVLNQMIGFLES